MFTSTCVSCSRSARIEDKPLSASPVTSASACACIDTTCSSSAETSMGAGMGLGARAKREKFSTRRRRRATSSSTMVLCSSNSSSKPSSCRALALRKSSTAIWMGVRGFLISCAICRAMSRQAASRSALRSRASAASSSRAMRLNACTSLPASPPASVSMWTERVPAAMRSAASIAARMGFETAGASSPARPVATAPPSSAAPTMASIMGSKHLVRMHRGVRAGAREQPPRSEPRPPRSERSRTATTPTPIARAGSSLRAIGDSPDGGVLATARCAASQR
jgi:hypothetical protein